MKVADVRAVLLSAPYEDPERNLEARLHLPNGFRNTGMVEVTLEDGTKGLGEGYLAVFAPKVFQELIDLLRPHIVGKSLEDQAELMRQLSTVTGYWSMQGAAQHALSAVEIAFWDCRAKRKGVPVYELLGGESRKLKLYASGGDSIGPAEMAVEIEQVAAMGIDLFKIRARKDQVEKANWCVRKGRQKGIRIGVDMTQNLAIPSQTVEDAVGFVDRLEAMAGELPVFVEEAIGPEAIGDFVRLRKELTGKCSVTGGEIITTEREFRDRLELGCYDIAQPDATVIGGIAPTLRVFDYAKKAGIDVWVHCWGGPVGMAANFHSALAGGGQIVEMPMTRYSLRQEMVVEPWQIEDGHLMLPDVPGLGIELTEAIEKKYPYRGDAAYSCLVDTSRIPSGVDWSC